jgi:hypothetical protein
MKIEILTDQELLSAWNKYWCPCRKRFNGLASQGESIGNLELHGFLDWVKRLPGGNIQPGLSKTERDFCDNIRQLARAEKRIGSTGVSTTNIK